MQNNLTDKLYLMGNVILKGVYRLRELIGPRFFPLHKNTILRLLIYLQCLLTLVLFCLVHGFVRFRFTSYQFDLLMTLIPLVSVCFGTAFLVLFGSYQYSRGQSWVCFVLYVANFAASMLFWHVLHFI